MCDSVAFLCERNAIITHIFVWLSLICSGTWKRTICRNCSLLQDVAGGKANVGCSRCRNICFPRETWEHRRWIDARMLL